MLRVHPEKKTYSAEIKHRTFGRIHLHLKTKSKSVAMVRHTALLQLLDTGEPARDLVDALRGRKLTIQAVEECVRAKRPFDVLRPSTWPTLGDAIALYVKSQQDNEQIADNTARSSETGLKAAREFFGDDKPMESITFEDVTAFKAFLSEKRKLASNTTALYLIIFGAIYTFLQKRETRRAMQQKRTPAVLFSPVDRDEHMPKVMKTKVRFFSEAEARRIIAATPVSYQLASALGLFGGLRIGEVEMLRPDFDISLERSTIYIQARQGWQPKYGRNREVPISSALEPFVLAHLERMNPKAAYLFTGRSLDEPVGETHMGYVWRRVFADAKVTGTKEKPETATFHTLRHTFASWLVMAGADLFTIARLMGHTKTTQIEETYGHLSPGHKMATVELLTTRWLTSKNTESTHPVTPNMPPEAL